MKIIDIHGNMTMFDSNGSPVVIANIKYGASYGSQDNRDMRTAMLTIYPGHNQLQDSFIFYKKGDNPFTFLQSRGLNPHLKNIYIKFLVDEKDKAIGNLLTMVVHDYFVLHHGYSHPHYDEFKRYLNGEITP